MKVSFVLLSALIALGATSPIEPIKALDRRDPPKSDGVSLLTTINKYRKKYGVHELKWSATMQSHAETTGRLDKGVNEIHHLTPPALAEVIAPGPNKDLSGQPWPSGIASPFEAVFVDGWLCEVSSDPEIKQFCGPLNKILHFVYSDTGHHDILISNNYNNIGCAFTANPNAASGSPYQGLWVCDLN